MSTRIDDIGDVIAERRLSVAGEDREIWIRIGKPRRFPDGVDYFCPYEILGLDLTRVMRAGGVDSMQALQAAISNLSALIWAQNKLLGGRLRWLDEQGEIGFFDEGSSPES